MIDPIKLQVQQKVLFWRQVMATLGEAEQMSIERQIEFLDNELGPNTDGYGKLQAPGIIDNPVTALEDILLEESETADQPEVAPSGYLNWRYRPAVTALMDRHGIDRETAADVYRERN